MNYSWPEEGINEKLKYVKSICSCEHTVIIMAVNIHGLIYLRTYFSLYAKQENNTNRV